MSQAERDENAQREGFANSATREFAFRIQNNLETYRIQQKILDGISNRYPGEARKSDKFRSEITGALFALCKVMYRSYFVNVLDRNVNWEDLAEYFIRLHEESEATYR